MKTPNNKTSRHSILGHLIIRASFVIRHSCFVIVLQFMAVDFALK